MRFVKGICVFFALYLCGGQCAMAAGLTSAEQGRLQAVVAARARGLDDMEAALRAREPARYYRAMKGLLADKAAVGRTAKDIKQRLVGEMALMQARNMRMGLGTDPKSWPPPDPSHWEDYRTELKSLEPLLKSDVAFLRNVRIRLQITWELCQQDRDTFASNEPNFRRDLSLLRASLDQLRSAVAAER